MYSPKARKNIMDHVLVEVATGRFVSRILREDEFMPPARTFWTWHLEDEEYQQKLAQARELGVEALLDETVDIADDANDDVYIDYVKKGKDSEIYPVAKIDGSAIRRANLRIETRIKMAQMLKPRKYGPKLDLTSGNEKLPAPAATDNRLQAIVQMVAGRKQAALPQSQESEDDPDENN